MLFKNKGVKFLNLPRILNHSSAIFSVPKELPKFETPSIILHIGKYETRIYVLKVKSTITRHVKCFVPGISTSSNLFKEIESVNSNAPGRALALNKCCLGEMKYIYKIKSLKGHLKGHTIT